MVELYFVGGAIVAIFCYGYFLDKKIVKNNFSDNDTKSDDAINNSIH